MEAILNIMLKNVCKHTHVPGGKDNSKAVNNDYFEKENISIATYLIKII